VIRAQIVANYRIGCSFAAAISREAMAIGGGGS
jgi:hypothetical protein